MFRVNRIYCFCVFVAAAAANDSLFDVLGRIWSQHIVRAVRSTWRQITYNVKQTHYSLLFQLNANRTIN
jgi:ubiquinone biosynthesis protein UbiJ